MRRTDKQVTDPARIRAIVDGCDCCRLGLCEAGVAYIVPMSFGYTEQDGQYTFFFHSAREGRKQTLLRQSPRIGFELDTNHCMRVESHSCTYSSVIGVGTVSFLTDPAEKAAGLRAILRHCIGRDDLPLTEAQLSAVCVFSLTVESLSCKESL